MADADGTDYLRPAHVAAVLHVSPKTVSRWAADGLLPCLVTLGGHRRFRRADVEEIRRRMEGMEALAGMAGGEARPVEPVAAE